MIRVIQWAVYLALAAFGTLAAIEAHDLWYPHKTRNEVWTTRKSDRWEILRRELETIKENTK